MGKKLDNKDFIIILLVLLCLYLYFHNQPMNIEPNVNAPGATLLAALAEEDEISPEEIQYLTEQIQADQEAAEADPPECWATDPIAPVGAEAACSGKDTQGECEAVEGEITVDGEPVDPAEIGSICTWE